MTLFDAARMREHADLIQRRQRLSALVAGTGNGKRRMGHERELRVVTLKLLRIERALAKVAA